MYNLDRVRIIITTHPRTTNVSKGSECSMKHGLKLQRLPRSETKSRLSNGLMQLKVSSQGNHPIRKEKQQLRHWATVMQLCSETPTRPRAISTCLPPGEAWRVLCNLCSVHCMITFSEPPLSTCCLNFRLCSVRACVSSASLRSGYHSRRESMRFDGVSSE